MRNALTVLFATTVALALAAPLQGQLIHHWALDGSGADSIGGNNGTLVGTASFGAVGPRVGTGFLHKDVNNDELSLANIPFANGDPWTATFWSKRFSGDGNGAVVSPLGLNSNNNDYIRLRRNFDEAIEWSSSTGDTVTGAAGSGVRPAPTATDPWVHYAVTSDGTSVTLYRDGAQTGATGTPASTAWTINSIGRGRTSGGQSREADTDDVALFSSELTAAQLGILIGVVDEPGLGFDAGEFGALYNQYLDFIDDGEAASENVGGLTWNAAGGLGAVGISEADGEFTIVFDDSGNGVTTASVQAVPEPGSVALWALLGLVGAGYYRWRRQLRPQP